MNRFYSTSYGRFVSADPSWKSANPWNPQSWNRYEYSLDDPVNLNDPLGLFSYTQAHHVLLGLGKVALGTAVIGGILTGTATTGIPGAIVAALSLGTATGTIISGSLEVLCGFSQRQQYCEASEGVSTATNIVKVAVIASGGTKLTTNTTSIVVSMVQYMYTEANDDGAELISDLADYIDFLSSQAPTGATFSNVNVTYPSGPSEASPTPTGPSDSSQPSVTSDVIGYYAYDPYFDFGYFDVTPGDDPLGLEGTSGDIY